MRDFHSREDTATNIETGWRHSSAAKRIFCGRLRRVYSGPCARAQEARIRPPLLLVAVPVLAVGLAWRVFALGVPFALANPVESYRLVKSSSDEARYSSRVVNRSTPVRWMIQMDGQKPAPVPWPPSWRE